jgi:lysyl-tRNA synthetase class 2
MTITSERAVPSADGGRRRPAAPGSARPDATSGARAGHRPRTDPTSGNGWRSSMPLVMGRFLQLLACSLLLLAVPPLLLPVEIYWAGSYLAVFGLSPEPFVFNAVLLLVLGAGLGRRQHAALVATIVFELPSVLTALWDLIAAAAGTAFPSDVIVPDLVAGSVAVLLITVLLVSRREFSARLQPAAHQVAGAVLAGGLSLAILVGGVLAEWLPGTLTSTRDAWLWAVSASIGLEPLDLLLHDADSRPGAPVPLLVSSISAASLLISLLVLLRTARVSRRMTADEELRVRALLAESRTDDSLAYFATRRDKSAVFSRDRRAAVSFRVVDGIALASGDPIGYETSWMDAVSAFVHQSRGYGWIPAVLSTTERGARCYERLGLQSTSMGEEAVLSTDEGTIDRIRRNPQVSAAVRRVRKAGYRAQMRRQGDLSAAELEQLVRLGEQWRDDDVERGFSMALSRFGDPSDARSVIVTALDADDEIKALLVFVPWNHDGLSLDLMRRSPDAVNGTTEFLVDWLVQEAADRQIARISLNFAMFREILVRGGRPGAGRVLRLKRRVLLALSQRWQLDSLRRANERYSPAWRPRLLLSDRNVSLGRVWLAAARAEGFIGRPAADRRGRRQARLGHAPTRPDDFADRVAALGAPAATATATVRRRGAHLARANRALSMQAAGVELYPASVARTHSIADVVSGTVAPEEVSIAGRVLRRRDHGGVLFLDLSEDHDVLQVIATADRTEHFAALRTTQPGDVVSITGMTGASRSGTPSFIAADWALAAKSLHELLGRQGLSDPETRVRQRHLDLAVNADAARMVRARSHAVQALRSGLLEDGYLEVETPILQTVHGGANARPFRTRINAYRADLTLRIAPELALKRLVVAGFPQVFEIGRNFRNEGADATHNPEFTAVEAYRAYADYTAMRHLAQGLITRMAVAVSGTTLISGPDGRIVDLAEEWPVITVCDAVSAAAGSTVTIGMDRASLERIAREHGVEPRSADDSGRLIERLYEELVEPATTVPTFYTDFPASTSPLTRGHRHTPGLAERWDLVAFGTELGTAYTELADPFEQRAKLTAQSLLAAGGDPEAMEVDESFLTALELGMPPTGGLGLGVDRIVMLLTGATIRESIAFPFVRPAGGHGSSDS